MKRFALLWVIVILLGAYTVVAQTPQVGTAITLDNAASVAQLTALEAQKGAVNAVLFSPDSSLLAYGGDDTIVRLWDVATRQSSHELKNLTSPVHSLAFNTDGTILAAGADVSNIGIAAWDTQTGKTLGKFDLCSTLTADECTFIRGQLPADQPGRIYALQFMTADLPSGQGLPFFGWGEHGQIVVWFLENNAGQWQENGSYVITSMIFSSDQSFRISGRTDGLGVFMTSSSDTADTMVSSTPVTSLALFADSSLAAGGADGTINLWTVSVKASQVTAKAAGALEGHQDKVTGVAFSPDGTLLVSSSLDGTLRLWDVKAQQQIAVLTGEQGVAINSIAFSPDGTLIASAGSDGIVRLWGLPGE